MKFEGYYSFSRFRYIHHLISESAIFNAKNSEIIPKTACFFSNELDVYIDTSDGVNEDLKMFEYCGRILKCISVSKGKKFLFFKSAYSPVWSKKIEEYATANNGTVIPFFKFSFNDNFYSKLLPNIDYFRSAAKQGGLKKYDIGFFADPNKTYQYPTPSIDFPMISCTDMVKFDLTGILGAEENTTHSSVENRSRPETLKIISSSKFTVFSGAVPYGEYLSTSMNCSSAFNPPGVGEYTSRMMDQTAVGNIIFMRKNSYDQGFSWKNFIPEIDLSLDNWQDQVQLILDESSIWKQKSLEYYENYWRPEPVFRYLVSKIEENI